MRHLSSGVLLCFIGCSGERLDETDPDPDGPVATETDVDAGAEPLEGDPWSGLVEMGLYVSSDGGGTTVGSFQFCTGTVELGVESDTLGGDLDCTGEFACAGRFRDQPIDGNWVLDWVCDDGEGTVELVPVTRPPEPVEVDASWDWSSGDATFSYGLTLTADPD